MNPGPPFLCLVTDRNQCAGKSIVDVVEWAVSGGVNMVQLREKDLPANQLYGLALDLRRVTQGRALLLVNDRVDVAIACGADGVQLGEEGLPTEAARRLDGDKSLVSRSVHSLESAEIAQRDGADLLVLGTIFASRSHPGGETGGLERVRSVSARIDIPVLAIGGITADNVASVMEAGASGASVITAITRSPDPKGAASALAAEIKQAWAGAASTRVARQV